MKEVEAGLQRETESHIFPPASNEFPCALGARGPSGGERVQFGIVCDLGDVGIQELGDATSECCMERAMQLRSMSHMS